MIALALVLSLLASVALAVSLVQAALAARAVRSRGVRPLPDAPLVSVLRPMCGVDDELDRNLESLAATRGYRIEIVGSVEDPHDPAVDVFRAFAARHPELETRLVLGPPDGSTAECPKNPKVCRLEAADRVASGEFLVVSDSNVRVGPDWLVDLLSPFEAPEVGCASSPFVGTGAASLGARVDSLHLLTFVLPGAALAAAGGVPCVVGKTMALRRSVLDVIGGFAAFRSVLAEDQAIGLAVEKAGFRTVLAPGLVRNVVVKRSLGAAFRRQSRWNRIRWAFSPSLYLAEVLLLPTPFLLLAAVAAAAGARELLPAAVASAFAGLLVRDFASRRTAAAAGEPWTLVDSAVLPLKDMIQLAAQFAPILSRTTEWRGHRIRIGRGTVLIACEI